MGSRRSQPRTASQRAPPPEARRAEPPQAAKRARLNPPRRTPPIFSPRPLAEAEASERRRASSTRSPAVDPDHEVCRDDGGEVPSPVRRPRPAAQAAGLWPEPGRCPEWRNAPRGGGSDGAWKERGHRVSRATRSGARVSVAARQRRAQRGLEVGAAAGGRAQGGKARPRGRGKDRSAQKGLEGIGARGETTAGNSSWLHPARPTTSTFPF